MDLGERLSAVMLRPEMGLVTALIASYILYFVFRRTEEFSKHAAQNTAATIAIVGVNIGAAIFFLDDLNRLAQKAYLALHIPTLPADFWQGVPTWLLVIIALAARDLVDYWNHRLMHTRWMWPTHAAHHSDTHVNAFTGYRVHFLEAFVMTCSYILLLTWLQMPEAIPFVAVFSILHNQYVHMNLPYTHGPFRYLLASPAFHRWHHADAPEAYGKNLANMMPIYDKLFGTYYYPGPCTAPMGAMAAGVEDKNPIAIATYPFREWARLVRSARARRSEQAEDVALVSRPVE